MNNEWKPSHLKQIYIDARGTQWDISELLASHLPHQIECRSVDDLWDKYKDRHWWSYNYTGTIHSLAEFIDTPHLRELLSMSCTQLRAKIVFKNTEADHIYRIAAMIVAIRDMDWQVPPIVIGPDGEIWDGGHRLCALKWLQIPFVTAIIVRNVSLSGEAQAE